MVTLGTLSPRTRGDSPFPVDSHAFSSLTLLLHMLVLFLLLSLSEVRELCISSLTTDDVLIIRTRGLASGSFSLCFGQFIPLSPPL